MAQMTAVQVGTPGAAFAVVQRDIPDPSPGAVRVKVEACGLCHSDSLVKGWPGLQFPRVPGHEVAGVIDAVGPGRDAVEDGQRVGVGWHGGHCRICPPCRRGDFVNCQFLKIPGFSYDGGYGEYLVAPAEALAAIPDELSADEAAPVRFRSVLTMAH